MRWLLHRRDGSVPLRTMSGDALTRRLSRSMSRVIAPPRILGIKSSCLNRVACSLAVTFGMLSQVSCSSPGCRGDSGAIPIISIFDATTKMPICDAVVLVTSANLNGSGSGMSVQKVSTKIVDSGVDGAWAVRVMGDVDAGQSLCSLTIASDAPVGVYSVEVTKPGYATALISNIYFNYVSCSSLTPSSQQVTVLLVPTNS